MARYDYRCPACNTTFEVEHPMSAHPTVLCPSCGAETERVFAPSGISLTGHGFYNTDQRSHASHSKGSCSSCSSSSCASCAK